jgi:hypothetical protein
MYDRINSVGHCEQMVKEYAQRIWLDPGAWGCLDEPGGGVVPQTKQRDRLAAVSPKTELESLLLAFAGLDHCLDLPLDRIEVE